MKDTKTIILSVIFMFAMTLISYAASEKKTGTTPPESLKLPVASKVQQITGDVKAVNTTVMSMTVAKKCKDKVLETVLTIHNETKISKNNEKKTLHDIKVGDKVVVKYIKVDGKNMAKSVTIKPAKPESKEKETEKQGNPPKK